MWIYLKTTKPRFNKNAQALDWAKTTKINMENKKATLIFELGSLQVFHYQTPEEIQYNVPYKDVYWQDKVQKMVYGPFLNVYQAVNHHVWIKTNEKGDKNTAKIIRMDFKTKKRLVSKDI